MDNKKVFFTYVKDEKGEVSLSKVCTINTETNETTHEDFDIDKHGELFQRFMETNELKGDTLVSELEEKGFFNERELTEEKLENFLNSNTSSLEVQETSSDEDVQTEDKEEESEFDSEDEYVEGEQELEQEEKTEFDAEDEYVDSNEEKDGSKTKRVVAGILAAGAVIGGLTLLHRCSHEEIVETTKEQTLEDLLNQMTPEQRAFFESSFRAVEIFNDNATKEGNFALDKDQSTLHMTVDEAVALNVILNNYSSDELYEIFGTVEFDTTNIMNLARSAYGKLSTYYMNAKSPSGLAEMINDEAAREFFAKHESAVIDFNNNPTVELSDKVISGLYNDYIVNGANGEYAKINNDAVAWFATTTGFGFELANRNIPEFLVSADGISLNQVTTSELLTGINEEVNVDVMDEIDNKSLCASVTRSTRDKIADLTMKQAIATTIIETNAKDELIEGLKEAGHISLANKVLVSDMTPALIEEISDTSSKANELVEEYQDRIDSLEEKEAKIVAAINLAEDKYNVKSEIDLADLVNNRFRSPLVVEKEPVVDTTPGVTTEEEKDAQLKEDLYVGEDEKGNDVYDGDKLEELPKEEKEEFIKDNGVVVDKETNVVEKEEVKLEDLTPEEQEQVISEEEILKELESLKNQLILAGVNDAITYTEEKGAYDYNGTLVNPNNNEVMDTDNMSLFNIAAYDAAFDTENKVDINVNDDQIQDRIDEDAKDDYSALDSLSEDAQKYLEEKYGSDWKEDFMETSYEQGYEEQVEGSLSVAESLGAEIRKTAEEEYAKAQEKSDELNKVEESVETIPEIEVPGVYVPEEEVTTAVTEPVVNETTVYDPNLDPNYSMPDELPYEIPGEYVLEDAFNNAISEETTSKSK